jgi:hypothetical protein
LAGVIGKAVGDIYAFVEVEQKVLHLLEGRRTGDAGVRVGPCPVVVSLPDGFDEVGVSQDANGVLRPCRHVISTP